MSETYPNMQRAVQLIGPNELRLNTEKQVFTPGPHQILGRVEVVGLCYSDLKLLKQFSGHVRKSEIIDGVSADVLAEIPSYVPGEKPTVPGHEVVIRVVAIGDQVKNIGVGERYLLQTDYRWIKTSNSRAAFGYNFEGALQEYVLMDQRVVTSPEGESMLIPAASDLPASALALVEPWACVEDSYAVQERGAIKKGGRLLIVGGHRSADDAAWSLAVGSAGAARATWISNRPEPAMRIPVQRASGLSDLADESFDDVVFFGADADMLEKIFPKIAPHGLLNIVQCGKTFGRSVTVPVGRVHYGGIRITGTTGHDPAAGYAAVPATGEIRTGDRIDIIGAGGPMGTMHVIRNLCQGVSGITVDGGDLSDERLAELKHLADPLAKRSGLTFNTYNPKTAGDRGAYTYVVVMAPVPALVASAVVSAGQSGIINIFAGIPANVSHPFDMDAYVQKKLYFIGTSGSDMRDMKIVLAKVESRALDTNLSVAAISGLEGAVDGIRAVEAQAIPGKILVYPCCKGLTLTPLVKLAEKHPEVAALLDDGRWTLAAEKKLVEIYSA